MRYRIGDNEYDFDFRMTVEEAIFLQDKAFCTVLEFGPALRKADARAIAVLIYTLKRRNREVIKWDDVLKMDVFSLELVPVAEDDQEAEVGEPASEGGAGSPDPT